MRLERPGHQGEEKIRRLQFFEAGLGEFGQHSAVPLEGAVDQGKPSRASFFGGPRVQARHLRETPQGNPKRTQKFLHVRGKTVLRDRRGLRRKVLRDRRGHIDQKVFQRAVQRLVHLLAAVEKAEVPTVARQLHVRFSLRPSLPEGMVADDVIFLLFFIYCYIYIAIYILIMSYISDKQISIVNQVPSASAQIAFDSSKWMDNTSYVKAYNNINKTNISPNGIDLNTSCTLNGNTLLCKIPK